MWRIAISRFRIFGFAAAVLLAASSGAWAQNYPSQRVTMVVPFTAGSITDGLARILADKLGVSLDSVGRLRGQPPIKPVSIATVAERKA